MKTQCSHIKWDIARKFSKKQDVQTTKKPDKTQALYVFLNLLLLNCVLLISQQKLLILWAVEVMKFGCWSDISGFCLCLIDFGALPAAFTNRQFLELRHFEICSLFWEVPIIQAI